MEMYWIYATDSCIIDILDFYFPSIFILDYYTHHLITQKANIIDENHIWIPYYYLILLVLINEVVLTLEYAIISLLNTILRVNWGDGFLI